MSAPSPSLTIASLPSSGKAAWEPCIVPPIPSSHRDVAIKLLPESFAQDPDRTARFEREAQVLASLNHPNIAAIHGIEERAIVMELVEGETLAGPLPLATALHYARQIAEALEYAHERALSTGT
jgi:eukaryotic-like serine/threonine-protein kinase